MGDIHCRRDPLPAFMMRQVGGNRRLASLALNGRTPQIQQAAVCAQQMIPLTDLSFAVFDELLPGESLDGISGSGGLSIFGELSWGTLVTLAGVTASFM